MAERPLEQPDPVRRTAQVVALVALPPGLVVGLVALVLGGVVAAVVAGAGVAVLIGVWARFAGEWRVRGAIGGRPAHPLRHARLLNLVDGLATTAGIGVPEIRVVDAPGLNALVAGLRPRSALLAVTSGLLEKLTRIELEAVVAEELVQIRWRETLPATVLAATWGIGRRWALPAERDATADQLAASLTRYPPGLEAALERLAAEGTAVAGTPAWMAHLWLASPDPARPGGRISLPERIAAVREL
ncbi:MAG: M48 family metalloprotease [Acidimicrobiales bacterium]